MGTNTAAGKSISFDAIKIDQPIGSFYIGVIPSEDLIKIAYADIRRLESRDVERYLGIQRPLSVSRVSEIKEYVRQKDAAFPTAVILAVDGKCATWAAEERRLILAEHKGTPSKTNGNSDSDEPKDPPISFDRIAKILDGQHRLAGLVGYTGPLFEVNVAVFIDADISEQANVFATVNLAQTKVNKSLVYDLFELARSRSPQKSAHNIAVALDALPESPFYHRIKRLGVATEGRFSETITQASFVESLLRYITPKASDDRDILLRGKKLPLADERTLKKHPFRNLFIAGKDDDITKIVWNYFAAVRTRWPQGWDSFRRGNMLIQTNGFKAFMRFLRPAYLRFSKPGEITTQAEFLSLFKHVKLKDDEFVVETFAPGSSGEASLYQRLISDTKLA